MKPRSTLILDVPISRFGRAEAVDACLVRGLSGEGGYVCFANAHNLTESKSDPRVRAALSESFLSVADGVPVVWASRLRGSDAAIAGRVCGPDFMKDLIERAGSGVVHGFIGGAPGAAEAVAAHFGLHAICYSPPMREFSRDGALEDWRAFQRLCPGGSEPRSVWVGLGAPKQELWMHTVSAEVPGVLFFGVGAAFDFWAGTKQRAPVWMQERGLEWLFRLGQEPGRLWRRYLVGNSLFAGHTAFELIRGRREER